MLFVASKHVRHEQIRLDHVRKTQIVHILPDLPSCARFLPDLLAECFDKGANHVQMPSSWVPVASIFTNRVDTPSTMWTHTTSTVAGNQIMVQMASTVVQMASLFAKPCGRTALQRLNACKHGEYPG